MKRILLIFLLLNFSVFSQQKTTGEVFLVGELSAIITLDNVTQTALITLVGPDDRWFALKYGSFTNGMQAGPDVLYFDGTTLIDASQTGSGPVQDEVQNVTIVSNTVDNGVRTFVVSRPFVTGDLNDFNFNFNNSNIDMAGAHGNVDGSYALSYHGPNRASQLDRSFQTLGVDDFSSVRGVVLYPNPAKDILSIDLNLPFDTLRVYTHSGRFIKEVQINMVEVGSFNIEVGEFSSGIYLLEFKGSNTLWEKVIIQ